MAGLVSAHQQSSFATPQNGDAGDAVVVLGNDNATVTTYNAHDADATIHLQSSTAATFAATPAGTLGRKWMTSDTLRLYYDTGSVWSEVAYALTASPTFTGTITVTGATITGLTAASVGAGTFPSGNFVFQGTASASFWSSVSGVDQTVPSALVASQVFIFAQNQSGTSIMGFGTTRDVSLKNRAGTTVLGIDANATGVTLAGGLVVNGAVSGITTLAIGGALSGATNISMNGSLSGTSTASFSDVVHFTKGVGQRVIGIENGAIVSFYDNVGGGIGTEVARMSASAGVMQFNLQALTTQTFVFTGAMVTSASTTSLSGLNIPHGTAPTSPVNGDVWTTTSGLFVRINGSTVGPLS